MNAPTPTHALRRSFERRAQSLARIGALAFSQQRAFIADGARYKAALCSRRAGKSYGVGLDILREHALYPGATSLYVGLTRETCKRIMWKDILEKLDVDLEWGLDFNRSELFVRSPNGSVTYFIGADSSEKEMAKVLGQKYRKAWIDEAQDFTIDLRKLAYDMIGPALLDLGGTLCLTGTPGDFIGPKERRQLFFAITKPEGMFPDEPREVPPLGAAWAVHRWNATHNPHMRAQFVEAMAKIDASRPWYRDTPEFRRAYLGEWVLDSDARVYQYRATENAIAAAGVPKDLASFAIAIDLGFKDDTAFSVGGWRPYDPNLYVLRSYKRPGWTLTQVAEEIQRLRVEFPTGTIVVDDASLQAVEELRTRWRLPLIGTQKSGKTDFIRMMNASFRESRIKVVLPDCQPLVDEYEALVWDPRASRRKELDSCDNHAADSALYLWRWARNHLTGERPAPPPRKDSEEYLDQWAEREAEEMRKDMGEDDH